MKNDLFKKLEQLASRANTTDPHTSEGFINRTEIKENKKLTLEDLDIFRQVDAQNNIFIEVGILGLHQGQLGYLDHGDRLHEVLSYQDVTKILERNRWIVEAKMNQGFTKIVLEPIHMRAAVLMDLYKRAIHINADDLAVKNSILEKIPLDLSRDPYYASLFLAELSDDIEYFPSRFEPGKGYPKSHSQRSSWRIWLVEDKVATPKAGQGKKHDGYQEFENGKPASWYLGQLLNDKAHDHEMGLTPEAWLSMAITTLETKKELLGLGSDGASAEFFLGCQHRDPSTHTDLVYFSWGLQDGKLVPRIAQGNDELFVGDTFGARTGVMFEV